jgi:hypothetical protein
MSSQRSFPRVRSRRQPREAYSRWRPFRLLPSPSTARATSSVASPRSSPSRSSTSSPAGSLARAAASSLAGVVSAALGGGASDWIDPHSPPRLAQPRRRQRGTRQPLGRGCRRASSARIDLVAEEGAGSVDELAADDDDLLAVEDLLGDDRGEANPAKRIPDGDLFDCSRHHRRQGPPPRSPRLDRSLAGVVSAALGGGASDWIDPR